MWELSKSLEKKVRVTHRTMEKVMLGDKKINMNQREDQD